MSPLATSRAQEEEIYRPRTSAYLPYSSPEPVKYNFKWGKLSARFTGGVSIEFSDNVGLSEHNPKADLSIGPTFGVGFLYPLTKENILQFDLSMGYRWYLNSPSINTISVAPNTHFDHTIIAGDVKINFHDNFSVQVDPLLRPEISTTTSGGKLVNFRRIHNTIGLAADWHPTSRWGFLAGYDYAIDRSLSGDFGSLDVDTHTFTAGAEYTVSPKLNVGASASYGFSEYSEKIQNGGDTFSVGPNLTWRPTKHVTVMASAGYSLSQYDSSGTIGDRSEFSGITYEIGIRHALNRRTSHDLRLGYNIGEGLGSNYTETMRLQYGLRRQMTSAIALGGSFAYETSQASGVGGEKSDRFLFNVGTGFQLSRRWSMGLSYAFAWRLSDLPDHGYAQNRITINLSRQF